MSGGRRDTMGATLSGWPVAVGVIVALNVVGWGMLLLVVVPSGVSYAAGGSTALAVGLAAYALGMRHAFDADHIAAIDNTTRRFVDRGKPASTVGLWFSLGHSTVVLLLCAALAAGLSAAAAAISDDDSAVRGFTGVWGPTVSSVFLLAIAAIQHVVAAPGASRRHRSGQGWAHVVADAPVRVGRGPTFAHVRCRVRLRDRIRYRHRDRVTRHRRCGDAGPGAVVGGDDPADPVRRGDVAAGHHPELSIAVPTRGGHRRRVGCRPQRRVIRYPLVMTGISAVVHGGYWSSRCATRRCGH